MGEVFAFQTMGQGTPNVLKCSMVSMLFPLFLLFKVFQLLGTALNISSSVTLPTLNQEVQSLGKCISLSSSKVRQAPLPVLKSHCASLRSGWVLVMNSILNLHTCTYTYTLVRIRLCVFLTMKAFSKLFESQI